MRKNLTLAFLLALSLGAAAQSRIAFTGGVNSSTVSPYWNRQALAVDSFTTKRTGLAVGFVADLPFSKTSRLRFQPGMRYTAKGATQVQLLDTAKTSLLRFTSKQFINYIDVPVNLVLALPIKGLTKFIVGGGPQVSLFYNGKTSRTTADTTGGVSYSELSDLPVGKQPGQYKVVHLGANALAGFEFGRVFLTANYSQDLTPFLTEDGKDFKFGTMGATLGIYLGKQAVIKPKKPAKDQDKDGIPDATDECPELPGAALTNGCPDRDGDGIADRLDRCPTRKGPADNNGCPLPDKDGDKIPDKEDKCPDKAGLAKYGGCPVPDTDSDGLNDEEDKCPQVAGPKENAGCPLPPKAPEVKKEVVEKINTAARQIEFAPAKAELTAASLPVLDEVVRVMQQDARLKLTIEGHTSTTGNAAANQKLSEQRAAAVKAYLEKQGVPAERVAAVGYGASRPVSAGKTEAEQAANRRVELKLNY